MVDVMTDREMNEALSRENVQLRARCSGLEVEIKRLASENDWLKTEMGRREMTDLIYETRSLINMVHRYQMESI